MSLEVLRKRSIILLTLFKIDLDCAHSSDLNQASSQDVCVLVWIKLVYYQSVQLGAVRQLSSS